MLRNKRILLIFVVTALLFLIPSICNAAAIDAIETTKTSTGKTVKWSYELDGESIINLKCTNKSEVTGTVNIPSTIDGHKVIALGDKSWYLNEGIFYECAGITGVVIPNTVVTIGEGAFYNCKGLQSVTIPNSVITIGDNAFTRTMISSLTIPNSVVSIGAYAFDGCSGINKIEIPESVVTIGNFAFKECSGVKSLTIKSNVLTNIGNSAFKKCVGLGNVSIPNSVTVLGESAFEGCSGLKNITLSNKLTKLEQKVFLGCSSLTSVIIPDSVTTIDGYEGSIYGAFQDCTKLEKVLIPDSVATILKSAFNNCPKLTIYGNDNQASKAYAEQNKVKFDYISNWDKASSGSDIAAPTVEKIYVKYSSVLNYWDKTTSTHRIPTGAQIILVVNFSEEIIGKTSPTLAIKFGVGNNINVTGGAIGGKSITYTYTIKSSDLGQINSVSLTGGDITDLAGNKAELSCPRITEQYDGSNTDVYANGTSATVQQGGNNQVTLSSIAVTKTPTKNTYLEGETFNKSGMVITATYSDGSKKEITNYAVSLTGALKTSDTKVVITYTENGVTKTVEQKITVVPKGTANNSINTNKGNNSVTKDETVKDTTIKNDSKLPQTGITVLSFIAISLIAVAVISKVKYGSYKDI